MGEGEAGKKGKTTQHAGGQSVSEKSQTTRTSKNLVEKSNSKTQYFVREVKVSTSMDVDVGSTSMEVDVDTESELNSYTKVTQVPLDTDPLMWWK